MKILRIKDISGTTYAIGGRMQYREGGAVTIKGFSLRDRGDAVIANFSDGSELHFEKRNLIYVEWVP